MFYLSFPLVGNPSLMQQKNSGPIIDKARTRARMTDYTPYNFVTSINSFS
jgi:hypothetical protein